MGHNDINGYVKFTEDQTDYNPLYLLNINNQSKSNAFN